MPLIDGLLNKLVQSGGSDLHLSSECVPYIRVDGDLTPIKEAEVMHIDMLETYLLEIVSKDRVEELKGHGDTDFAYELPGVCRFRANIFQDRKGIGAVFRTIPSKIPTLDQLKMPPIIKDCCLLSKGLVLVTGPTGSGKSTTLAAIINEINSRRKEHIITIEDPIEFIFENGSCLVNQREVKRHTSSFKRALRAALREDPDIVLIGEMRDLETIEIALETAETGHLVFGTLHTATAASTVDRIIDQFPADRQSQIRTMLASNLKGVISQTLCKKLPKGRIAAVEILVSNAAVSGQIREGKTHQIPNLMQSGASQGMCTLNNSLIDFIKQKVVDPVEAYLKCIDKGDLKNRMENAGMTSELHQVEFFHQNGVLAEVAQAKLSDPGYTLRKDNPGVRKSRE